jgi:GrpB-like predicted nucleotidyltransferase (UPF0157 family)
MDAPVVIEPYSEEWPRRFADERGILEEVLRPWLAGPVEHIGSTAVPGLAAKPIIDIMAAVESLEASRPALARLAPLGYLYAPYRADAMHWLCKPSPEVRTHHLQLVPMGSPLWKDRIAFRDRLRSDPTLADAYASLKRDLARMYVDDRESYTDAKQPFVEMVLRGGCAGARGRPPASQRI